MEECNEQNVPTKAQDGRSPVNQEGFINRLAMAAFIKLTDSLLRMTYWLNVKS
jgi:hypothetical protein